MEPPAGIRIHIHVLERIANLYSPKQISKAPTKYYMSFLSHIPATRRRRKNVQISEQKFITNSDINKENHTSHCKYER